MNADDLDRAGLLATARARASVKESLGIPGTIAPERLLTARLFDGLDVEVLPGRGFDLGDTWHRGVPISWFSPVADARALPAPHGTDWLTRFTGGLLTTCGLDSIGVAEADGSLHGRASHLPAQEVSWRIEDGAGIRLDGTVEHTSLFGPSFRLRRRITLATLSGGASRISVVDDVRNIGPAVAALNLMYHLNFGAPLVVPGSRIDIEQTAVAAASAHPDVPDWSTLPAPVDHVAEAVFAHHGVAAADGIARACITSAAHDLGVVVEWSAATLPHLHQWVFPTRGRWALGIEPATAPLFGPERDGADAGAPLVLPGRSRSHRVRITIGTRAITEATT